MKNRARRFIVTAIMASGVAACSLDKQEMPPLAGPSELGLSLTMTASPDTIPRDGASQSVVTITARDAMGTPVAGQTVKLALAANAPQGAGLSQTEVTTGSTGQATFAVTAPIAGSVGNISVMATPAASNSGNVTARIISITALPVNSAAPVITDFVISNATPDIGEVVTFDASCQPSTTCATTGVTDEGVPCNNCTFSWNFGDGGTAVGQIVRHAFVAGGTHQVALTATDVGGVGTTLIKTVTANSTSIPSNVSVTMSPDPGIAGQLVTFTASATAATNHRITSYQFNFGDGSSTSQPTPVVQHAYAQIGTYQVTLTVRDDLGQLATTYKTVTVNNGTATFSYSVSGTTVAFTAASASSSGAPITEYAWDFDNDGTYDDTRSSATTSHDFGASGAYTVKLKVTDSRGLVQTTSQSVVVP